MSDRRATAFDWLVRRGLPDANFNVTLPLSSIFLSLNSQFIYNTYAYGAPVLIGLVGDWARSVTSHPMNGDLSDLVEIRESERKAESNGKSQTCVLTLTCKRLGSQHG
jgi:hypothetical protein